MLLSSGLPRLLVMGLEAFYYLKQDEPSSLVSTYPPSQTKF